MAAKTEWAVAGTKSISLPTSAHSSIHNRFSAWPTGKVLLYGHQIAMDTLPAAHTAAELHDLHASA